MLCHHISPSPASIIGTNLSTFFVLLRQASCHTRKQLPFLSTFRLLFFFHYSYYDQQWLLAQQNLTELLQEDTPERLKQDSAADAEAMSDHLSTLYLRYLAELRRLERCYDQMAHPQKRRCVRRSLDGVLGRLLELKHELSALDSSDFHYLTGLGVFLLYFHQI